MFLISSLPLFSCPKETVEKSHSPMVCSRQAACHHGAVIKKGCEEMMTISSQPFFKREYQMRIMLPAAKRRQ